MDKQKIYNFSAGPAVLPDGVIKQAAEATVNYNGHGMSIFGNESQVCSHCGLGN